MSAAHGQLALLLRVSGLDLDPRSDRVAIGTRLLQLEPEPVAKGLWRGGRAAAHVAVDADVLEALDDDEVEHPVAVQVDDDRAARLAEVGDARVLPGLDEGAVRLAQEQIARVLAGEGRVGVDIALRDEQVHSPIVVDVLELGVPCRRGQRRVADVRPRGRDVHGQRLIRVLRAVGA